MKRETVGTCFRAFWLSSISCCTISSVGSGAVSLEAKSVDGSILKSVSFDVPNPQVTLVTNLGTLKLELNPTAAPLTVGNFLQYVNDKFYDNTIIH